MTALAKVTSRDGLRCPKRSGVASCPEHIVVFEKEDEMLIVKTAKTLRIFGGCPERQAEAG